MSSGVQAAHSSNHHQFHTIHPHNTSQHQKLMNMMPGSNSDDNAMNIHPLRQPPVTTSRQVSQDSNIIVDRKDNIEGTKPHKNFERNEMSYHGPQASVITPRESDLGAAAICGSSSTKISIFGATNSINDDKNNNTDDVVRQVPSTLKIPSSTHMSNSTLPPVPQTGTKRDTANAVGRYPGSSNTVHPIATSLYTISPSTITTHSIESRSPQPIVAAIGTKRKMPFNAEGAVSPVMGSSQSNIPNSRRDSLPMGLRNKKMKATDCLLFAATLLEQDAVEALVMASTTPSTTNNRSFFSNGSLPATSQAATLFVPPVITSSRKKKTKPLKKMVCEKIERSLQEIAKLKKKKQQEKRQEQQRQEDMDGENKPKDADVLCGRGGKVNKHPGNIIYRKVVEYNKSYYQSVHKKHRILVSQSIVKAILNYGGRFMGQKGKEWTPICFKRAVQKTSQALRERSNSSDSVPQAVYGDSDLKKQMLVVEVAEAKN